MITKICTGCQQDKNLNDFSLHAGFKDGHNSKCKQCKNKRAKEYFNDNRKELRAKHKNYNKIRRYKKYNLSLEEFNLLLTKSQNACQICKRKEDLCIDHCHKTNKVRGILCKNCNTGIGMLQDDIEVLSKSIAYLEMAEAERDALSLVLPRRI